MFVLQGREFGQGVAQEGQVLVTPAPCHGLQVGFDFEPVLLEPVMVLLQALHMGKQFGTRPFQQAGEDNGLLGFVVLIGLVGVSLRLGRRWFRPAGGTSG